MGNHGSKAMKKCILIIGLLVAGGCSSEAGKSESINWVSAGTLVSASPDVVPTSRPGRVSTAVLGDTRLNSTRIETTEGVYVVSEKVGFVELGTPVRVGYSSSDEKQETPLYLSFGGQGYNIVR
jgi:hypothetical protein